MYLDDPAEWGPELVGAAATHGGLEGEAGNAGQDSSVSGWVGLAAALADFVRSAR